jgi:hypothetical protein
VRAEELRWKSACGRGGDGRKDGAVTTKAAGDAAHGLPGDEQIEERSA